MPLSQTSTRNILLRSLSPADYQLIQPHLRRIDLKLRQTMFTAGEPIEDVHFPEGGVASIVAEQEGGEMIEVGLYGREGMSGSAVVLGAELSPHASMIQVNSAQALTIAAKHLSEGCRQSASMQLLMLRYAQSLSVQAALTAAANAHYALPERLARWLLMCHDRVETDQIELTHEFIAMMLGVRRSGVTVTLHTLEATGSIRANRGVVTVADRGRLEEIAGDAYGGAEAEYRRLIAPFGKGRHGLASVA